MKRDGLAAGCQTFTWEMLGDAWRGGADDLLDAIAQAGYAGIEITDRLIGRYADDPAGFGRALEQRQLTLVAFACGSASGFTEPDALRGDLAMAERAVTFASNFRGAHVSFGSATLMSPGDRAEKFRVAAQFYNEAGAVGARAGVPVAVHPSSHHDTLLLTRADYDALFGLLDTALVGWVPDTGHMLRGGHDMLDTLATYRDLIRYVHLKDVDASGAWQMLGQGTCNVAAVIETARSAPNRNGWIVVEEESEAAGRNPVAAVAANRETLRNFGI